MKCPSQTADRFCGGFNALGKLNILKTTEVFFTNLFYFFLNNIDYNDLRDFQVTFFWPDSIHNTSVSGQG